MRSVDILVLSREDFVPRKMRKNISEFALQCSFLLNTVPKVGLEPTQPLWPRDFKSLVSTIPPFRQPDLLTRAKVQKKMNIEH